MRRKRVSTLILSRKMGALHLLSGPHPSHSLNSLATKEQASNSVNRPPEAVIRYRIRSPQLRERRKKKVGRHCTYITKNICWQQPNQYRNVPEASNNSVKNSRIAVIAGAIFGALQSWASCGEHGGALFWMAAAKWLRPGHTHTH